MSQQKVDKYKENKSNRRQIMKKQKLLRRTEFIVVIAVLAAAVVWFGISVYNSSKASESAGVQYIDSKAVVDYMTDPEAATKADASEEEDAAEEEALDEELTEEELEQFGIDAESEEAEE